MRKAATPRVFQKEGTGVAKSQQLHSCWSGPNRDSLWLSPHPVLPHSATVSLLSPEIASCSVLTFQHLSHSLCLLSPTKSSSINLGAHTYARNATLFSLNQMISDSVPQGCWSGRQFKLSHSWDSLPPRSCKGAMLILGKGHHHWSSLDLSLGVHCPDLQSPFRAEVCDF